MNVPKDTQNKIMELQMLEQNMQNFMVQKQKFQISLNEIENALKELESTKETEAYRIIGEIMIKSDKKSLEKDLNDKKNVLELRIKNIDKQEDKIKDKFTNLQKEVIELMENEKPK